MSPARWSTLSKERKQLLVLGLLVSVVALVAAVNFGLQPMLNRIRAERQAWTRLQDDLDKVERNLRRLPQEMAAARDLALRLDATLRRQLPPAQMPLPHVVQAMQTASAQTGLEWIGYDPISRAEETLPSWVRPPAALRAPDAVATDLPARRLTLYAVRFNLRGSYPALLDLLARLENGNPTLNVRSCEILAGYDAREPLAITLELEWLKVADPRDDLVASIRTLACAGQTNGTGRFWADRMVRRLRYAMPPFRAWLSAQPGPLMLGAGLDPAGYRADPFADAQAQQENLSAAPTPAVESAAPTPPDWEGARKQIKTAAVMRAGARAVAVINGLRRTEGETVSLMWKGRRYTWKVLSIDEKDVKLEPVDGESGAGAPAGGTVPDENGSKVNTPHTE